MNYKIPIETSARHIHLSREDFDQLFGPGKDLTPKKYLSQPGQYLAQERVNVMGPKGSFKNVGIIGPLRSATQLEVSATDCRKLGIPAVIRQSGDIEGTPGMTVSTDFGTVVKDKGAIVAKRHIHMTCIEAMRMHVKDNEEVFVVIESNNRSLIFANVVVRVSNNFRLAMHLDTDEANAFAGDDDTFGVILKLFEGNTYNLKMWAEELLWGINR